MSRVSLFPILLLLMLFTPAHAQIKLQGAGATFPAPLYAKWCEAYHQAHPDVLIDYQAMGSAGLHDFSDHRIDFEATDIPISQEKRKDYSAELLQLPTVAGGAVIICNVPGVMRIRFNGEVLANIYLKKVVNWRDPALLALNPDAPLPDLPIVVAHKGNASGTTRVFTDFLSKVSAEWSQKVGKGIGIDWPTGISAKGCDGVSAVVQQIHGAIGYIEYAYASKNKVPFATLLNAAGKPVGPSIDAITAAATAAFKAHPDELLESITNSDDPAAYPIAGYTTILVYKDLSFMADKSRAEALVNFLLWCLTDGQSLAPDLGYTPLPKDAQSAIAKKLRSITYGSEPLFR
jgi:phosphate transport system substrate-binding protein